MRAGSAHAETLVSLMRQVSLLLLATVMLAFVASFTVNVGSARDMLQAHLRLGNRDDAAALASVLSQQNGERDQMERTLAARFDTGYFRRIAFAGVDGDPVFAREAPAAASVAPAWFVALLPIAPAPGRAQVSNGWRAFGSIEVISQTAYVHDELWRSSVRAAIALAGVGVLSGLLAWLGVRSIRRPLDAAVEQAASLQRGEYLTVAEPNVPELRRLTRAMNSMVARLRVVFEAQSAQVENLRQQANCDALSGLSNRAHFMAQLGAVLHREDGQATGSVVLLRVLQLADVNRRLGHESTDRLIVGIAHTLQAYVDRVPGALVGRLNGSDFALALPEGGVALESAQAIVELLRAVFVNVDPTIGVAAGVVETNRGAQLGAVMGAADLALARAETVGAFMVETPDVIGAVWGSLGAGDWRQRLLAALRDGRAQLGHFPVVDRAQALIHLECPLRLQLDAEGPFEVAAHWLPLAIRSRLTCEVDECALAIALDAIALDGRARCVNLSPASLADSGFAARLRAQLQAAPDAARLVWLEVRESAAVDRFELVRELAREVRGCGVRFGLEHAGERLGRVERLFEAGLDYVKLDAAVGHGVATDERRAELAKGLVTMLHSLSLQVIAEGVSDAADADALWALGVDGITGPCVVMPSG